MRPILADRRSRHLAIAAAILLAALAAAVVIYLRAASEPETLLELSPETSKKYLRDLETIGGTANVLAVETETWFAGLWHGRSLAWTVAVLGLAAALGYVFFAVILPPYAGPDEPDGPPGAG